MSVFCLAYEDRDAHAAASRVGIVFMLYVVCSLFYNYFVLQLRGFDLVPRYSFFSVGDTLDFFRRGVDRLRGRSSAFGSGGGYRGLAVSHEEGVSILSGPPGYLDEQDDEEELEAANGIDHNGVIRL